jgi:hypothetical protein
MRRTAIAIALALIACGAPEPPPLPAPPALAAPATWFICDALNMPAVLVFERDGGAVRVAHYDKPNGALVQRTEYQLGAEEGAAGSVYVTLLQNGAEAGAIRRLSTGVMEAPVAAYTTPFTSVRLGESEAQCRWMPRTRVLGITGKRTVLLHEDGDGDLIYTSYDFADAAAARAVELAENGRTTTFSAEVRGGGEDVGADGETYAFRAGPITYSVGIERNGAGALQITGTPTPQAAEPFIALQRGVGAE